MVARIGFCCLVVCLCVPAAPAGSNPATVDVTYTAREYAFSGPDEIAAGWISVKLMNQGEDLHQLQFIKLPDGKTAKDFTAEIIANHKRLPPWVQRRGGPNSIISGQQAEASEGHSER